MHDNLDRSRARWLEARSRTPDLEFLIGGSDMAAILGWSPWSDPFALWHEKHGLAVPRNRDDDDAIEAGHMLERAILRWYEARTGRIVVEPADVARALLGEPDLDDLPVARELRHLADELAAQLEVYYGPDARGRVIFRDRARSWRAFSPDAFTFDESMGWGIVDAKAEAAHLGGLWRDEHGQPQAPPRYAPQIAHMVAASGLAWGGFAVLIGGITLLSIDHPRDKLAPLVELVTAEGEAFAATLRGDHPPPPQGSDASLATLKALYPAAVRQAVGWVAPVEVGGASYDPEDFDQAWVDAHEQRRAWQDRCRDLEVVLRYVAKDAHHVLVKGGGTFTMGTRITRREPARRR